MPERLDVPPRGPYSVLWLARGRTKPRAGCCRGGVNDPSRIPVTLQLTSRSIKCRVGAVRPVRLAANLRPLPTNPRRRRWGHDSRARRGRSRLRAPSSATHTHQPKRPSPPDLRTVPTDRHGHRGAHCGRGPPRGPVGSRGPVAGRTHGITWVSPQPTEKHLTPERTRGLGHAASPLPPGAARRSAHILAWPTGPPARPAATGFKLRGRRATKAGAAHATAGCHRKQGVPPPRSQQRAVAKCCILGY